MLKSIRKPLTVFLFLVLAISVLALSGCESALIDNGMLRTECEIYVNALLEGDFEAAHAITPALSKEEHRPYFDEFCKSFEGATSYKLTQTGWNINTTNGVTTQTAAYQIELDNGTICQLALQTTDGVEGIAYINFNDSTKFIESTKNIPTVNIVLLIVSIALMAFPVWMLIDCIKRKILQKAWWIVLILLSFSLTFSIGAGSMNTSFMLGLACFPSSIKAVIPNETITLTLVLPLGALIYCILRKKLSAKYEERLNQEAIAVAAEATLAAVNAIDAMETPDAPATTPSVADFAPPAETAEPTEEESSQSR